MKAKSGGSGNSEDVELLTRYRELVAMQASVIHALVAAVGAVAVLKDEAEEEEVGSEEEGEK